MTVRMYRPDGEVDTTSTALAAPFASLTGRRIAVLDNGKPNAAVLMTAAAAVLAEHSGATVSLVVKKGPGGRSANAAVPCAPDVFARVRDEADVVITGAADCGSCSAYSVHDAVELERCGVPTVLVTTTRFEPVARALAAATGLADLRMLVVDHPIGGVDHDTLLRRADAAVDALAALFTTSTVAALSVGSPALVALALDELRAFVAHDGADLLSVEVDTARGVAHLRLAIPDADCAECVMPRPMLEAIVLARLADAGIHTVTIDDPRERS